MLVGIIGGGAWGTTIGQVLVDNGHEVIIYDNNPNNIEKINNHFHPFFPNKLSNKIKAYGNLNEVVNKTNILILAVPTKVIRVVLKEINKELKIKTSFVNISKGLEPETGKRVSDLVKEEIKLDYLKNYAVLTGPSHAEEVIERKVTLLTAASENVEFAQELQVMFSNNQYMRVYTTSDVIGSELGGAVKNAIAVVSGMLTGMKMGENSRAALITRGILEISRVVKHYGGNPETAFGLTGIGDLIVTASSDQSRNFRAGKKIGEGLNIDQIYEAEPQTIEGFRSIEALNYLSTKEGIYLPIITTAYQVIFENMDKKEALKFILSADLKEEKIE